MLPATWHAQPQARVSGALRAPRRCERRRQTTHAPQSRAGRTSSAHAGISGRLPRIFRSGRGGGKMHALASLPLGHGGRMRLGGSAVEGALCAGGAGRPGERDVTGTSRAASGGRLALLPAAGGGR